MEQSRTRIKRQTIAQKVEHKAPWAALLLAVPALIAALQSYSASSDAKSSSRDAANEVSENGYARDNSTWQYTRLVLGQQSVEIAECRRRTNQALDAITELQKRVFKKKDRPLVESFRYDAEEAPKLADDLEEVLSKGL